MRVHARTGRAAFASVNHPYPSIGRDYCHAHDRRCPPGEPHRADKCYAGARSRPSPVVNLYERVSAARAGDLKALDHLVGEYLPLVYTIVGRALPHDADTDDVVQDVFVEALRDLRKLRDPAAFRSWLVAITLRQIRRHGRYRRSTTVVDPIEAERTADPGADFADLTVAALHLSGQRREVAEATRWLDPADQEVLSLYWLEVAGHLTRAETAGALGLSAASAAVRVQRMRARLETARSVVRALRAAPTCPDLAEVTTGWDGRPDGLWRKRIARHVRDCARCSRVPEGVVPPERLLVGLPLLLPAPALRHSITHSAATPAAGLLTGGKLAALGAAAAVVVAAAAGVIVLRSPGGPAAPEPAAQVLAPALSVPAAPSARPSVPVPSASRPSPSASPSPSRPKAAVADSTFPIRAAFYYPWYRDNFQGADGGTHWHPSAGKYSVDDPATVERQIKDMRYGGLDAGISSWWGRGEREDKRFPLLLRKGAELGLKWSLYYEPEGYGDPSSAEILADLKYLGRYTGSPAYLHVKGKPVIFVWADGNDACGMADRWAEASKSFYVVLKVFGGYRDCRRQPSHWHQYGVGVDVQKGYSAMAGPGFWLVGKDKPMLERDLGRFREQVRQVARSGEPFQLIISYNEWGEGTACESASEWASATGHGRCMDILHEVFGGR